MQLRRKAEYGNHMFLWKPYRHTQQVVIILKVLAQNTINIPFSKASKAISTFEDYNIPQESRPIQHKAGRQWWSLPMLALQLNGSIVCRLRPDMAKIQDPRFGGVLGPSWGVSPNHPSHGWPWLSIENRGLLGYPQFWETLNKLYIKRFDCCRRSMRSTICHRNIPQSR